MKLQWTKINSLYHMTQVIYGKRKTYHAEITVFFGYCLRVSDSIHPPFHFKCKTLRAAKRLARKKLVEFGAIK
jgi:hypothetical protein